MDAQREPEVPDTVDDPLVQVDEKLTPTSRFGACERLDELLLGGDRGVAGILDEPIDQADATLDVEKRKLVMKQIEELMQEEGPIVQPLWRAVFTGVNKKVKGFQMHPTSYLFAEEWSI